MKALHKLKLRPSLRTMRIPPALLHRPPLPRNDTQRLLPVPRHPALHQPTPNDHPRAPDTSPTMYRADPAAVPVIPEHLQHAVHVPDALGERAIADGEAVIFDCGGIDALQLRARTEDVRV